MRNKWIFTGIILVAVLIFVFLNYNKETPLQIATNASSRQSKIIERILKQENIGYSSKTIINISDNSILEGMDENWEAYDLTNKDGSKYLLILRKSDKDFTALLDSEYNLITGIIDNGVLPKLFK